jgi:hypothetical protein
VAYVGDADLNHLLPLAGLPIEKIFRKKINETHVQMMRVIELRHF